MEFLYLWSFDHARCDAILIKKGVVIGGINLNKGSVDAALYGSIPFTIIWLALVVWSLVFRLRRRVEPQFRGDVMIVLTGCYFVVGLLVLLLQFDGVERYVHVCRSLLRIT